MMVLCIYEATSDECDNVFLRLMRRLWTRQRSTSDLRSRKQNGRFETLCDGSNENKQRMNIFTNALPWRRRN
jgi:hypothetical protein